MEKTVVRKLGSSGEDEVRSLKIMLRLFMRYAIHESNGPEKDSCKVCEKEWDFEASDGGGIQYHKTWCTIVKAYKLLNHGELPANIRLV